MDRRFMFMKTFCPQGVVCPCSRAIYMYMTTAKDSHILSTENNSAFVIFKFEILAHRHLTLSLILNN